MRANVELNWLGDKAEEVLRDTGEALRNDIARRIAEKAKEFSPYETGHNRASIAVLYASGKTAKQGKAKRGPFRNPARFAQRDTTGVVTTSGYGAYLEMGARAARYTKKGKTSLSGAGTRGSHYMSRALAHTLRDLGHVESAAKAFTQIRAQRAGLRRQRTAR